MYSQLAAKFLLITQVQPVCRSQDSQLQLIQLKSFKWKGIYEQRWSWLKTQQVPGIRLISTGVCPLPLLPVILLVLLSFTTDRYSRRHCRAQLHQPNVTRREERGDVSLLQNKMTSERIITIPSWIKYPFLTFGSMNVATADVHLRKFLSFQSLISMHVESPSLHS